MAINLRTRYGARANDASIDYPTGSFKNKSAPTAVDGTPLEKDWANDWIGARDAILKRAGITASGSVETSEVSDVLDALEVIIDEATPAAEDVSYSAPLGFDVDNVQDALDSLRVSSSSFISGLVVTNNASDLQHDIDISSGQYGGVALISPITKRLDAAFSPGDNGGGIVGSLPANGVIYIFLIQNGSAVDVYAETTNGSSPPDGWSIVKRIAVRVTDSSSNIQRVNVYGNGERLTVSPYTASVDWSVSSLSTTRTPYPISGALSCPPNVDAYISHHISSSSTAYILLTSIDSSPVAPTDDLNSLRISAEGTQDSTTTVVRVDSNRQVAVRSSVSSISDVYYGQVLCWIEDRS